MPDCVLDKRLKQQAGNQSVQCRWREAHFDSQAVLKSDPLDIEIEVGQLHLTAQWNLLRFPPCQGFAQKFAKVGQHLICFLHSMLSHEYDDCVQSIEEKVGMELHLECAQLRLCELALELSCTQLELRR